MDRVLVRFKEDFKCLGLNFTQGEILLADKRVGKEEKILYVVQGALFSVIVEEIVIKGELIEVLFG